MHSPSPSRPLHVYPARDPRHAPISPAPKQKHRAPSISRALSRNGWETIKLIFRRLIGAPLAASALPPFASLALMLCSLSARAQYPAPVNTQAASPASHTLDRVVAVVNNHAILSSDIDEEIRLSILDPAGQNSAPLTPPRALEQLISRALIEQQMRQEDIQAAEPSEPEVAARLKEIRTELPACVHANCASDAGWKAFLAAHGITSQLVDASLHARLQILSFIELRFRQGISVSDQEIAAYYNNTLLPLYTKGEDRPSLEKVSPRIQEILLQQKVNVLFDEWLRNLRSQGDVEVLDPSLEDAKSAQSETKGGR
jgi:peptidyl-prolyl cis-trans isomerase SurA